MIRIILLLMVGIILPWPLWAQSGVPFTVDIVASVPGCGDGFIQTGEQCDGATLGGTTCSALGFAGGTLSCSTACTFITDQCSTDWPTEDGGGTQIRSDESTPATTNLVVAGQTVPGATVTLLKDGQPAGLGIVKADGTFQITIARLSPGSYLLQLSVALPGAQITTSDSFHIRIVDGATTKVTGLVVPFILQSLVRTDDTVSFRGIAIPQATVALQIGARIYEVPVQGDGSVVFEQVVSELSTEAIVRVYYNDNMFERRYVLVEKAAEGGGCSAYTDVTGDCRVNIVDFVSVSITTARGFFVGWFDFNKDGAITIVDFSIMAFYWTG